MKTRKKQRIAASYVCLQKHVLLQKLAVIFIYSHLFQCLKKNAIGMLAYFHAECAKQLLIIIIIIDKANAYSGETTV